MYTLGINPYIFRKHLCEYIINRMSNCICVRGMYVYVRGMYVYVRVYVVCMYMYVCVCKHDCRFLSYVNVYASVSECACMWS